jgi:hypothetical protein
MNIVILTETPYKYPSLTGDMLFRLWKAAIKDDDTLANEVIRGIYDGMMAFDRERAEDVMDLTVRRHPTSRDALRALLKDMQVFRSYTKKLCPGGHWARAWQRRSKLAFRIIVVWRGVFFKLPVWQYASDQMLAVS